MIVFLSGLGACILTAALLYLLFLLINSTLADNTVEISVFALAAQLSIGIVIYGLLPDQTSIPKHVLVGCLVAGVVVTLLIGASLKEDTRNSRIDLEQYGYYIHDAVKPTVDELLGRHLTTETRVGTEYYVIEKDQFDKAIITFNQTLNELSEQYDEAKTRLEQSGKPFFATADIRTRLRADLARTEGLHQEANRRTLLFQNWGLGIICFGLVIVAFDSIYVLLTKTNLSELRYTAPIVGIVFNLVGSGMILFHRSAAKTAMDYYDRSERLNNRITALELLTNPVMNTRVVTGMSKFIQSLYMCGSLGEDTAEEPGPDTLAQTIPNVDEKSKQ